MTQGPSGRRQARPSIRVRIAAAFALSLLASSGALVWLISQQAPVHDSLRLVTEGYLPLAKQVARIKRDQERVQRDLNRIMKDRPRPVTGDTSAAEIYTGELEEGLAVAKALASNAQQLGPEPEEQAILAKSIAYLDTIDDLFVRYERQSAAYLELADDGRADEGRDSLRRPLRSTAKQLSEEFDKLERTLDARIVALTEATRARQAEQTAAAVGLATVTVLFALALLLAALVALQPIQALTVEVQRVAQGESGARVAVRGDDEVGLLAREFNQMAQAIEQRDRSLKERAVELDRLSRYLASVVDSLDDGLIVVEHGQVTLVNPAAAAAWSVAVDRPPPETLHDVLAPGRHTLTAASGTVHAVRSVPFGDGGVVTVLSDVTDQLRAQERLARSERLALIGQMLSQVTHEVRNPLNALSLNAELLGDEVARLDPDRRTEAWELLEMITGEVERLTSVTGHYLQLARRQPTEPQPCALGQVVTEVARLLEPELHEQGVTLTLDLGPVERQHLDGNQLRQALLNVLRNAVEAGARHLELTLSAHDGTVRIALTDDGEGMDDQAARQATDPFFSTKASGTGLGLAITRQILEDHDGWVEVSSGPDGGATVALVLPDRPVASDLLVPDDASA